MYVVVYFILCMRKGNIMHTMKNISLVRRHKNTEKKFACDSQATNHKSILNLSSPFFSLPDWRGKLSLSLSFCLSIYLYLSSVSSTSVSSLPSAAFFSIFSSTSFSFISSLYHLSPSSVSSTSVSPNHSIASLSSVCFFLHLFHFVTQTSLIFCFVSSLCSVSFYLLFPLLYSVSST